MRSTITRPLALGALLLMLAAACSDDAGTTSTPDSSSDPGSRVAGDGDRVAVHYTGTLDDGSEFDSSEGRDPLSFVVGSGDVISGFDDAVRGLAVGESRTVRLEPAQAYGDVDPELIVTVPLDQAPPGLEVGRQVQYQGRVATVVELTEDTITVDANHPLAGQALTFAVELVSIG